jgi:hypothetical protein
MLQGAQVASQLRAGFGDRLAEGRRAPVATAFSGDVAAAFD